MPALVLTYGAAYLGIASGDFELACIEGAKRYPSGTRRIDAPINQRRMAEMSAQIESARALLHAAASAADQGRATSPLPYIQAKVLCSEAASHPGSDDHVRRNSIRRKVAFREILQRRSSRDGHGGG